MKGKFLPILFLLIIVGSLVLGVNSCKDTSTSPTEKFDFSAVLVDVSDNPVADATVKAFDDAGAISEDVTDEFGSFKLTGIPGDFKNVKVTFSGNGFPTNQYDMAALLQSDKYKESKKVKILRNDTCKGLVVITTKDSATGNLKSNVAVKITRNGQVEAYGKTGDNGKISFGNFCVGEYNLRISYEGYKVIETKFTLGEADTLNETFLMQLYEKENCCSQVNVLVKEDGSGNVIANAQVKLARVGGDYKIQNSNDNGKTSFNDVCDGVYWLRIAKDGYQTKEQDGITFDGCDTTDVTIILKKVQDCCGFFGLAVKDSATGDKLPGVSVKISKEGWAGATKTTGDNGTVTFGELCPGKYWARIVKDGYKVIEDDFTITECDTIEWNLNLVKQATDTCCDNKIITVVKNGEGQVQANAKVKLMKGGQIVTYKITGDDGKVTFENLCTGTYSVYILKEGYATKEYSYGEITCHQTKDATVVITSTQNCCGYFNPLVLDSATGNALQGASIKLTKEGWAGAIKTTGDNGKTYFGELCPGKYYVRISKDNYKVIETYFTITLCDTLKPEYKLQVLSKDTCCDNKLIFYPKDSESKLIINGAVVKLWKGGQIVKTLTIANGDPAKFYELCTGTYGISVSAEGYTGKEANYTFTCSQIKEEILYLTKNQQDTCCDNVLKINVKEAETDNYLSGATVKLYKGSTLVTYKTTGDNGQVVFENLCSGSYSIKVMRDGYNTKEFAVGEITCHQTKELVAPIVKSGPCNTAAIKYKLVDYDSGTPIYNASVKLKLNDQVIATGTTTDGGYYIKEGLTAPNTYVLVFEKEGYQTVTVTIQMSICKLYTETVKIKKN
jgi:hypothetical protein